MSKEETSDHTLAPQYTEAEKGFFVQSVICQECGLGRKMDKFEATLEVAGKVRGNDPGITFGLFMCPHCRSVDIKIENMLALKSAYGVDNE